MLFFLIKCFNEYIFNIYERYGKTPSPDQMKASGGFCPICQVNYGCVQCTLHIQNLSVIFLYSLLPRGGNYNIKGKTFFRCKVSTIPRLPGISKGPSPSWTSHVRTICWFCECILFSLFLIVLFI